MIIKIMIITLMTKIKSYKAALSKVFIYGKPVNFLKLG